MNQKPLTGLRVLDLTQIVAGPYCSMMLADAGAEVIKVEPPAGEPVRTRGLVRYDQGEPISAYFLTVNRGKRSIVVDLKSEAGREEFRSLIKDTDLLLENFRKGTMERFGLGYDSIHELNPQVMYASIRAYSDDDEVRSTWGGLALVAEGEGGIASYCVDRDGRPIWFGFPLADYVVGLTAYGAITTALAGNGGRPNGQLISVSMLQAVLSINAWISSYEMNGNEGVTLAQATAPYGYYQAKDGFITIAVTRDKHWVSLCDIIGRVDLGIDPRYKEASVRNQRPEEVREILETWLCLRTRDECVTALNEFGVPCGRVNTPSDLLDSDELSRSGYLIDVDDGSGQSIRLPANPMGYLPSNPRVHRFNEDNGARFTPKSESLP